MQNRYSATIYILSTVILGVAAGSLVGTLLDTVINSPRTVAILGGLGAVGVDVGFRNFTAQRFPKRFLSAPSARMPLSLLLVALITAVAAGLATHDVAQLLNFQSGLFLGGMAGLISSLITATMVVLVDTERNNVGGRDGTN